MRDRDENDVAAPMPDEVESYVFWCIARGEVDEAAHEYTGDKAVWIAARHAWAAQHGWPGGEDAMLAGEVDDDDDELPEDVFEAIGLPHSGAWHPRKGEGVLVCREHDLTPVEHLTAY